MYDRNGTISPSAASMPLPSFPLHQPIAVAAGLLAPFRFGRGGVLLRYGHRGHLATKATTATPLSGDA